MGIGASVASSPRIASADPFSFDPNDIAISFDGTTLFKDGSATADSGTAGEYNFAFADGANSYASATDGSGDVAEAEGTDAEAYAGTGSGDVAEAEGTDAEAYAGTGNGDTATAIGNDSLAESGIDTSGGSGSNDFAYVLGANSDAYADGDYTGTVGNNDIAAVIDPFGTVGSDAYSGGGEFSNGDFDLAAVFGDGFTGFSNTGADAEGGNYLVDIVPTVAGLDSALSTLLSDIGSLF
jgi:trimeric autotransporter adhesin